MPRPACYCAAIPTLATRTRLLTVRHCSERAKTSNTGRLLADAVPGSVLVDHGLAGEPTDLTPLLGPDAWVLYPGGGAPPPRVGTLVVLDGSWSQVRGMRWRISPLASLPSFSLPAPEAAPLRARRAPGPDRLATIEAVAAALDLLGEPEPAAGLRALFAVMAGRLRDLRGFDLPP